jgi:hypothetical protein
MNWKDVAPFFAKASSQISTLDHELFPEEKAELLKAAAMVTTILDKAAKRQAQKAR